MSLTAKHGLGAVAGKDTNRDAGAALVYSAICSFNLALTFRSISLPF